MAWTITLGTSVLEDLRWFGRKTGRFVLQEAEELLKSDPITETRNNKSLRPNLVAQRELRLSGKYRILYNVDAGAEVVTIIAVGEKRGNTLIVRGEEYTRHHEDHPAE